MGSPHARDELLRFDGVGPKVAGMSSIYSLMRATLKDCVALFSLEAVSIVPIDTHVLAIAKRDYDDENSSLKSLKSLTKSAYALIGDAFKRFGDYAGMFFHIELLILTYVRERAKGWAHTVLFTSELDAFHDCLPADMVAEIKTHRANQRQLKRVCLFQIQTSSTHTHTHTGTEDFRRCLDHC